MYLDVGRLRKLVFQLLSQLDGKGASTQELLEKTQYIAQLESQRVTTNRSVKEFQEKFVGMERLCEIVTT